MNLDINQNGNQEFCQSTERKQGKSIETNAAQTGQAEFNGKEQQDMKENMGQNQGTYYKGSGYYSYSKNQEIIKKNQENDVREFGIFGPISLIYAIVFVFCLYKNFSGVTSVIFSLATVYYMVYMSKKFDKKWKPIHIFISAAIILLGFSNFITGNNIIIFFNYVAIICLIAVNMMYLFLDTEKLNVTKHLLVLLQMIFGSVGEYGAPFRQFRAYFNRYKTKKHGKATYVVIGIIASIPLLFVIGSILASADGVFKEVITDITGILSIDQVYENVWGIGIMLVIGYIVPYAFSKYANSEKFDIKEGKSGANEPIIAIIVTGSISLLYMLFSGIQIVYLFLGKGTLPINYSYAEYAREGFFQLLFVSAFNLVMVLVCIEFFKESKILKAILTVISLCTFIMIVSSAYRLSMYTGEYGLTFTRISAFWALIVITFVMAGLLYQLLVRKFNLFRYSLVTVTICFLIFSLCHVDYWIAKYDLNMYEKMQVESEWSAHVDYYYLMELSTDAAPAMMEHRDEVLKFMEEHDWSMNEVEWSYYPYDEDYNKITFRNFNVSKYIARSITVSGKNKK